VEKLSFTLSKLSHRALTIQFWLPAAAAMGIALLPIQDVLKVLAFGMAVSWTLVGVFEAIRTHVSTEFDLESRLVVVTRTPLIGSKLTTTYDLDLFAGVSSRWDEGWYSFVIELIPRSGGQRLLVQRIKGGRVTAATQDTSLAIRESLSKRLGLVDVGLVAGGANGSQRAV
jgi:hypothetical protein